MLKCNFCKWIKNDSDFYVSNQTKCKECVKKSVRDHREKNAEYYREYDKSRANNPDRVEARERYAKTPAGISSANKAKRKWESENAVKRKASNAVSNAVRDGKLVKPKQCSECKKSDARLEGHHDDYSKPLVVRWLCSQCHRGWHKENGSVSI